MIVALPASCTKALHTQRVRLNDILRRHVIEEDIGLSDDQLVHQVVSRYAAARELHAIIDPAE